MPSSFADAWTQASTDIDRKFGEPFLYRPMKTNTAGGREIPDPDRAAMTITAALTEKPTFVYPETRSRRGSVVAQEATQDMLIDIADTALPYRPQSGDLMTQVATGAVYQVSGPQPDGIARTELRVFKRTSGRST